MIEADLLGDKSNSKIGLQQQQLGLFDSVAHQVVERCAAELLLHASSNIYRMEADSLPQFLYADVLAIVLAQVRGSLLGA
ncbi:hypothetical protein D3C78_1422930 [compost metagenome]